MSFTPEIIERERKLREQARRAEIERREKEARLSSQSS